MWFISPGWILSNRELVSRVVPGDRFTKMAFGWSCFWPWVQCWTVLLFSEKWDTGNLWHEVTSQWIKLSLVYCDEMPTEAHALDAKWLLHLTVMAGMMIMKIVVWDGSLWVHLSSYREENQQGQAFNSQLKPWSKNQRVARIALRESFLVATIWKLNPNLSMWAAELQELNSEFHQVSQVQVGILTGKEWDPKIWNGNMYLDPDEIDNLSWKWRNQRGGLCQLLIYCLSAPNPFFIAWSAKIKMGPAWLFSG